MAATELPSSGEDWLQTLHEAADAGDEARFARYVADVALPELARALETFPYDERAHLLANSGVTDSARLLLYLNRDAAVHLERFRCDRHAHLTTRTDRLVY